jgi:hypothetical protein
MIPNPVGVQKPRLFLGWQQLPPTFHVPAIAAARFWFPRPSVPNSF